MVDDVAINKAAILERCVARIREEYAGDDANLFDNQTRQDAIILNLQRACEAAIDLAMHRVRLHRLGVPQESRDAFSMLSEAGRLDPVLSGKMAKMVGFRNVAVHDYRSLNISIVKNIVTGHLDDFLDLARWALAGD